MSQPTRKGLKVDCKSSVKHLFKIVHEQIQELQSIAQTHVQDMKSEVSKWSLHEQLEHLNITSRSTPRRIEEALQSSLAPESKKNAITLFKNFVIDRYTEVAPDFSIPKGTKVQKLLRTFKRLEEQFLALEPLLINIDTHFGKTQHPILGALTAREWLMFMAIHQDHHLHIIHDIIKS